MEGAREMIKKKNQSDELDLIGLIKIIYKGRRIVLILTLLGVLLGAGLGYFNDRENKESYTASIEFLYKPKKIDSSEELKVYAFDIYVLNSLIKKDGIISNDGGYETPTITIGDNTTRFNRRDRYSYRIYTRGSGAKEAVEEIKLSFDKLLEEAALLGYNKENFYKLTENIERSEPESKQVLFVLLGMFLGLLSGVTGVFFKEFWCLFKKKIKYSN